MPSGLVLCEQRDAVAVISLNAPDTLNALTPQMLDALAAALQSAMKGARAIVLRGEGRGFCAGFNIGPDLDLSDPNYDAGAVLETHLNGFMLELQRSPVPIVTAVRGAAVGAGASLALSGDLIVAGSKAYFLHSFTRVGLVPDSGASWLLARTIGRVRAMELVLLGDRLDAATAMSWGLVNRVVEDDQVDATAIDLALRLARGPSLALARTREAIWKALDGSFADQLELERRMQREAGQSPDFREGVAAFREKRQPKFV
jgi:2-(1,2-epoxy-1,2-dihydrophenyl)acetyl-CoA isomerase